MPEGDTVFRAAAKLHRALAGKPLTKAEIRWGRKTLPNVIGRQTIEVVPRGKHMLHRIEGGITVHTHLRMDGTWRVVPNERLAPRELQSHVIRAVFGTSESTVIGRRLGMLDVLPTAREETVVGHVGPDILGPSWDAARVLDELADDPRPIGEALLDQRVLAGIGTLYDSETLFLERIQPWTPSKELGRETLEKIITRAHRLLHVGKEHDVQSTTGSRRHGEEVYVHARSGKPCRRCGKTLRVAMIGPPPHDRTMFYCPHCQGGLAPNDDGRRQAPLGHRAKPPRAY